MTDPLDDLLDKHLPSRSSILSLVDDYTLFCYYLGQDVVINQALLSPLRVSKADTLPSFVVYPGRNGELRYFDHGTGGGGSVLDFIQRLYGYKTLEDVYARISADFNLGLDTAQSTVQTIQQLYLKPGTYYRAGLKDVINCEFTPEGIAYWNEYYITREILAEYNVKQVKYLLLDDGRMVTTSSLTFSYRIGTKHKIYQPFEKEFKFRNNYPRNYVEGYYQLVKRSVKSPVLFITKSTKDVMCYRRICLDAVAPKAENQLIPEFILEDLKKLYPYIFMVFDDDEAGRRGASKYPFPAIWIPVSDNIKDTADYMKHHGPEMTKKLLKTLVTQ